METQTPVTGSQSAKQWKRRNIPLVKLKKDGGPGTVESIEGVFLKRRDAGEHTDTETGEVRQRHTLIFQGLDGDKFQIWENAGVRGAIEMNDVQEGDTIRLVHLGKVPRAAGKTGDVNQYDVFSME